MECVTVMYDSLLQRGGIKGAEIKGYMWMIPKDEKMMIRENIITD